MIEDMVATGQQTYKAIKYAPFPVVGAPSGMALGGGCEILLHSRRHRRPCRELYRAGGGRRRARCRAGAAARSCWLGPRRILAATVRCPPVAHAFETISTAKVGRSAAECRDFGILRASDEIVMNRERLLAAAKAKALALAEDYQPPAASEFHLPGPSGKVALMLAVDVFVQQGKATAYDRVVAEGLADVLTGGPNADPVDVTTEDKITELERKTITLLLRQPNDAGAHGIHPATTASRCGIEEGRSNAVLEEHRTLAATFPSPALRGGRGRPTRGGGGRVRACEAPNRRMPSPTPLLRNGSPSSPASKRGRGREGAGASLRRKNRLTMTAYQAPLRDMRFVLFELHGRRHSRQRCPAIRRPRPDLIAERAGGGGCLHDPRSCSR